MGRGAPGSPLLLVGPGGGPMSGRRLPLLPPGPLGGDSSWAGAPAAAAGAAAAPAAAAPAAPAPAAAAPAAPAPAIPAPAAAAPAAAAPAGAVSLAAAPAAAAPAWCAAATFWAGRAAKRLWAMAASAQLRPCVWCGCGRGQQFGFGGGCGSDRWVGWMRGQSGLNGWRGACPMAEDACWHHKRLLQQPKHCNVTCRAHQNKQPRQAGLGRGGFTGELPAPRSAGPPHASAPHLPRLVGQHAGRQVEEGQVVARARGHPLQPAPLQQPLQLCPHPLRVVPGRAPGQHELRAATPCLGSAAPLARACCAAHPWGTGAQGGSAQARTHRGWLGAGLGCGPRQVQKSGSAQARTDRCGSGAALVRTWALLHVAAFSWQRVTSARGARAWGCAHSPLACVRVVGGAAQRGPCPPAGGQARASAVERETRAGAAWGTGCSPPTLSPVMLRTRPRLTPAPQLSASSLPPCGCCRCPSCALAAERAGAPPSSARGPLAHGPQHLTQRHSPHWKVSLAGGGAAAPCGPPVQPWWNHLGQRAHATIESPCSNIGGSGSSMGWLAAAVRL